jgi:hypothetical protein
MPSNAPPSPAVALTLGLLKRLAASNVPPVPLLRRAFVLGKYYPGAALRRPAESVRFLLRDPEWRNFTYEIGNYQELDRFLARALGVDLAQVSRLALELREDEGLRADLTGRLAGRRDRKPTPLYGRRVGWYVLVRVRRPRLVVEAGVHDGLGSAVLLRAMQRNAAEGFPGQLVGIDVNPASGWLVGDELRAGYDLRVDDSHRVLERGLGDQAIDLFIHDSNHSYAHELREYELVLPRLSERGVLLSDNAHIYPVLKEFAARAARRFDIFLEKPVRHFYPGAAIGLSMPGPRG